MEDLMWSKTVMLPRWMLSVLAGLSMFATAGYGQLAPAGALPPIPASEARVWFYRDAGPYESQQQPYILMNGTIIGVSQPRGSFYLDVQPGFYHVTVQQYLDNPQEAANINAAPGQQVFLKIVSLTNCIEGGERTASDFSRPCFYVWDMPTQVAQADVAQTPFYGGR
jgi:hypothetical protein